MIYMRCTYKSCEASHHPTRLKLLWEFHLVISSADEIYWKPEEDNEINNALSFASICVYSVSTFVY